MVLVLSFRAAAQADRLEEFYAYDLGGERRSPDDLDFRQHTTTFLFREGWTHGTIVSANNIEFRSDSCYLNMDKMAQSLWVTSNYRQYFEIDRKEFKSVTFYVGDSAFVFQHVYYIDNKHLFQVIIPNNRGFALFKLIKPVLRKRELPNGIQLTSYVDVPLYYVLFPNKEYRKIRSLKRKAIMKAFGLLPEKEKVDEYLQVQGENYTGESYLTNLLYYLNS